MKKFVIVEGLIGAGKTSLALALGKRMDAFVQQEPAEGVNPYLSSYYADPKSYAFKMQIYLLKERFRAHLAAQSLVLANAMNVVSDRSYFGDRCFMEVQVQDGYFTKDDRDTYLDLHKDMQRSILYPTCMIYLKTDVRLAMERIARRMTEKEGRLCECAISEGYMRSLALAIDRMIQSMRRYTTVIDIDPIDHDTEREKTVDELVDECMRRIDAIHVDPYDTWQGVI